MSRPAAPKALGTDATGAGCLVGRAHSAAASTREDR